MKQIHFYVPLIMLPPDSPPYHSIVRLLGAYAVASFTFLADDAELADISFVIKMSAVLGAAGGLGAALRELFKDSNNPRLKLKELLPLVLNHFVNMGLVGLCFSFVALWWFQPVEAYKSYLIIGIAGFCGLVGLPIIEPIAQWMGKMFLLMSSSFEEFVRRILRK